MNSRPNLLSDLIQDPGLYLHDVDLKLDEARFWRMSEAQFRDTPRLDRRTRRESDFTLTMPLNRVVATCGRLGVRPSRSGYLFHIETDSSALLSLALGELRQFHVLRDPQAILSWSAVKRQTGRMSEPARNTWREILAVIGAFHSRVFHDGQIPVLQSSDFTNIIPDLLELHPGNRGLFCFAPLEAYLRFVLSDPARRDRARDRFERVRQDLPGFGIEGPDPAPLTAAQACAGLWLVSVYSYCDSARRATAGSLRSLESDRILEDPVRALREVARHFGGDPATSQLQEAVAKARSIFPGEARPEARGISLPEIDEGLAWAEAILKRHPIRELESTELIHDR